MENSNKAEIKMPVEVVKIERLTSSKGKQYAKITSKHYINSNGAYIFVNIFSFDENYYNDLLDTLDVGDTFTAKGSFNISIYKDEKTNQYKNGFAITL